MRVIQLRKNRVFKVIVCCVLFVPIVYLLYTKSNEKFLKESSFVALRRSSGGIEIQSDENFVEESSLNSLQRLSEGTEIQSDENFLEESSLNSLQKLSEGIEIQSDEEESSLSSLQRLSEGIEIQSDEEESSLSSLQRLSERTEIQSDENFLEESSLSSLQRRSEGTEKPVLVDGYGNFEPPDEPPKKGPGEGGKRHDLRPDQENEAKESLSKYGMNMACSDEISLDRTIPDLRLPECKHWNYPEDLPKASVVVVFHNEGFSTLMRTVHSVINRTPPQFLEEVLLVDDFSDKDDLKSKLESYIERFGNKVRVIRNKAREGLINTRSRGAKEAHGEVIVFLDAHCEVNKNWLPPLLAPIYNDRTTMTVPVIDGIDHSNFEVRSVYEEGHHFRGIFEWGMLYKENDLPAREINARAHHSEPYKSPTHAGGLFAINREYFLELGAYDSGLLVWGGENFELSFKIWQCGGKILWVPCSRVGHVYRGFMPYNFGDLAKKKKGPLIVINYKRVIETWFDEKYKEYFYTREPLARFLDMGDISQQLELKKKLQCKNFEWFMENVAYDVTAKFPELPPNIHWGELRNLATKSCMDTMGQAAPTMMGMSPCHGYGNNQTHIELKQKLHQYKREQSTPSTTSTLQPLSIAIN